MQLIINVCWMCFQSVTQVVHNVMWRPRHTRSNVEQICVTPASTSDLQIKHASVSCHILAPACIHNLTWKFDWHAKNVPNQYPDLLSMKWQWTYGPTLLPLTIHFHTLEACLKPLYPHMNIEKKLTFLVQPIGWTVSMEISCIFSAWWSGFYQFPYLMFLLIGWTYRIITILV